MGMTMDWSKIGCIQEPPVQVRKAEPLARHTSFRIGGPADYMAFPASQAQLAFLLRTAWQEKQTAAILGAGTNVLAADAGKRGLTICTRALDGIRLLDETALEVECGVSMARAAAFARDHGLTGLEFAHGIPGSVGGGVFMNAGAYGGEICQVAAATTVLAPDGAAQVVTGADQGFAYRRSAFQEMEGVIFKTVFTLQKGDPAEITEKMQALMQRRRASQPLDMPSAGSTFKRPVGAYAAALIEQCGLKGKGVGAAAVSEKHAGFVVNLGGATAADVLATIRLVQREVQAQTGFTLEPEVKLF